MSFRILLALVLTLLLVLSFGFITVSLTVFRDQINLLLPSADIIQSAPALHTLLVEQAVALFLFAAILCITLFWLLGSLIARPLRKIVKAMDAFSSSGERIPLPKLVGTPTEIRSLASVFVNFADRVEQAHAHDVEISRVKSDFISTAAHQFRTPLTGIRWALEALEKEPLTPDQQLLVKSAVDKSHELVAIMGTLLDISSIESGKYKYAFAAVDLKGLVSEVVSDFTQLAAKSQVTLFFNSGSAQFPPVRADRERVKWVLTNLIENAIRYTPAGGSVGIEMEASNERLFVRVRDTGIGIEPQDRANIFERFYRASNAIAKENGGNGLGLYIARTIATDHGGDLNFQNNENGPGTTFALSLPIARFQS